LGFPNEAKTHLELHFLKTILFTTLFNHPIFISYIISHHPVITLRF